MAWKIFGLSDYKKQQNVSEILLCSARILQSEKLNSSLSVSMLRIDQVGTLLELSHDVAVLNCRCICMKYRNADNVKPHFNIQISSFIIILHASPLFLRDEKTEINTGRYKERK